MSTPIKVYIAGEWDFRGTHEHASTLFKKRGLAVVSKWLERETGETTPSEMATRAVKDTEEMNMADVLVAIMLDKQLTFERSFTKIGFFLGQQKPVFIVCDGIVGNIVDTKNPCYSHRCMYNPFFHHFSVKRVDTLDRAICDIFNHFSKPTQLNDLQPPQFYVIKCFRGNKSPTCTHTSWKEIGIERCPCNEKEDDCGIIAATMTKEEAEALQMHLQKEFLFFRSRRGQSGSSLRYEILKVY